MPDANLAAALAGMAAANREGFQPPNRHVRSLMVAALIEGEGMGSLG
jgi:hypothetical protein